MRKRFIFTCGDINGIGPEIIIKSLNRLSLKKDYQYIVICPSEVFRTATEFINPLFKIRSIKNIKEITDEKFILFNTGKFTSKFGKPTSGSGKAAYLSLEIACDLLKNKFADALITAPISKEAIRLAGFDYPGHTELLAEWFNIKSVVMMFLSKKIKAALTTIHTPLSSVPGLITRAKLKSTADVVIKSMKQDFDIRTPKIGILGLNPHAGEAGIIGDEESKILKPFIKQYKQRQYLLGPFSPDAYWGNKLFSRFDLTLGMYHDQVLIPFKLLNFSKGVNYTAGLPIVRTSPDHGVAYDIAGKNLANESSLFEAFSFAEIILNNRSKWITGKIINK